MRLYTRKNESSVHFARARTRMRSRQQETLCDKGRAAARGRRQGREACIRIATVRVRCAIERFFVLCKKSKTYRFDLVRLQLVLFDGIDPPRTAIGIGRGLGGGILLFLLFVLQPDTYIAPRETDRERRERRKRSVSK